MTSPPAGGVPGNAPAIVPPSFRPGRLVGTICAAEILGMTPFSMFLALQPQLHELWNLSNTEAGWISSAYYAGYMIAVPILASLTDRFDARSVWLASTALAIAATAGFGVAADGVSTAAIFQFLAGASLGGTYMPGLKLIADRFGRGIPHPRFVAFYTTSFTVGSSLSFAVVGQLAEWFPWRLGITLAAAGPVVAWLLVSHTIPPAPRPTRDARGKTVSIASEPPVRGHWVQVVRSAGVMRYVFGYACHMWELFAVRAWLVAFFAFCERVQGRPAFAGAATLAGLVALVGVPASIAGAELSARFDRRRVVPVVMIASALASPLFGAAVSTTWTLILVAAVVSSALVGADSAALTSGIVAVSPPEIRGTVMALYSMVGFASASAGAFAVGALLDLMGGQSVVSWIVAFGVMGASNLPGALVLARAHSGARDAQCGTPGTHRTS